MCISGRAIVWVAGYVILKDDSLPILLRSSRSSDGKPLASEGKYCVSLLLNNIAVLPKTWSFTKDYKQAV
jgi:hypothetical protein